jgi:hypothetical protein
MISPFQLSDSLALRAKAEAINSSAHGALDRIVASLLATRTKMILRSREEIVPTPPHPSSPFELRADNSSSK